MKKIKIYDTTLRDGAQAEGISFSIKDKISILKKLDETGIHYIEGGWPASNPKEEEFFEKAKKIKLKNAKLAAFGSTRRANMSAAKDSNLKALIKSGAKVITIFGKSWKLHVKDVLKTPLSENYNMVYDSVNFLKKKNFEVIFDAEHFFDGYLDDKEVALKILKVTRDAGADTIVLCDTNGGMVTSQLKDIVTEVRKEIKIPLGIHVHNDSDMAVANSIAAVEAGCSHVQGTINGYGERCGNANLVSIIPILKLKLGKRCISTSKMSNLTKISRFVSEISNMKQLDKQPFVGRSAFAHKGGVHINAVMKNPVSYEHIEPEKVGNKRRLLVSELSGKSTIHYKSKKMGVDLEKDEPHAKKMLNLLQDLEHEGYQYEAAEASFELLMKKYLKKYTPYFKLEGFRVIVEKRQDDKIISVATIKISVNKEEEHTVAEGDGPVNALDNALRKALTDFYPEIKDMHLSDFKVRVLDEQAGTAAKVRVLIQSQDKTENWNTVGVSENIIEASWQALTDSFEYKIYKDRTTDKRR